LLDTVPDSLLAQGLPEVWTHTDEWYVFFDNPRAKGFNIVYTIVGDKIMPNGNMLFTKDKNFGMGKDHPVAWSHTVGKGKTFYTFVKMLENAIIWE